MRIYKGPVAKFEFQNMLADPAFVGKVFEATDYALASGNEAGFACYRGAGSIALSEVILAENYPGETGASNSIDMDWVTQADDGKMRPDLIADLHVHPRSGWSSLRHSVTDLRTHCEADYQRPGYISMVAIPRPPADSVHLAIARTRVGQEGHTKRQLLNRLDDSASVPDVQHATRFAGVGISTTDYDIHTRTLRDRARLVADNVFRRVV